MNTLRQLLERLLYQFSLAEDKAQEGEIVAAIKKSVEFQGVNAWVLIFAIFVASIGLNVNSTAVVIGAMLISPLMGPIMGIGLSIGIYDFALLKKSFTNLAFMVLISLSTSFLYFLVSPISMPSSELLARTTPTIWDVAIAFFGGMAGIVVGASKEKGNAIPGVAIATALMPPLCTAGYGLAARQIEYFLGAFYLFFINAVMIGFASALVVRLLGYQRVSIPDPIQRKRVKRITVAVIILTIFPSIWLGYRIVDKNLYEFRLNQFINQELNFPNTQPILRQVQYQPVKSAQILLIGEPVPEDTLIALVNRRSLYKLHSADIRIRQSAQFTGLIDSVEIRKNVNEPLLQAKTQHIARLERLLDSIRYQETPPEKIQDILAELRVLIPDIENLAIGELPVAEKANISRTWFAWLKLNRPLSASQQDMLSSLLKIRLKKENLQVVFTITENQIPHNKSRTLSQRESVKNRP